MSFFDTKEEVLDVQLTQFGKRMLSIGQFRPVFYSFFDDDVIYDAKKAGVSESQNESEQRIINETPKLKTQYLTSGIQSHFISLEELGDWTSRAAEDMGLLGFNRDEDGEVIRFPGNEPDPEIERARLEREAARLLNPQRPESNNQPGTVMEQFRGMHKPKRNYDYNVQEKILLYPLANQEVANPQAPSFDVVSLETKFKNFEGYQHFTSSGIIKNIPQFKVQPKRELVKDMRSQGDLRNPSEEEFYDLTSGEIIFRDDTKINLRKENIILDIQELNTMLDKDNFVLEIYEITDMENRENLLRKIDDPSEIRSLFHIKTDETISHLHDYKTQREKNYQDRSRS